MNDRQEAKLSMYQEVSKVCHMNELVYATVPVMNSAVQLLDDKISGILNVAGQQLSMMPQGASSEKHVALDAMTLDAVQIANSLYVYAIDSGNAELKVQMSVNKSVFYSGHVNDSLTLARNIAAAAQLHLSDLVAYGVDAGSVARLNGSIVALENVLNNPRTIIVERKVYTENIKQLFSETDSILYDRLDKLITMFKTSNPNFYALYKNARNIIDTAKRSRKPVSE